jgi:hypothetical protein
MTMRKTTGTFLLLSFALLASSAVCLASLQVGAMADCSTGHGEASALCPFMSASIPTIASGSAIIFLVTVFFLVLGVLLGERESGAVSLRSYEQRKVESRAEFFDPVVGLISQGILHSRVYAF